MWSVAEQSRRSFVEMNTVWLACATGRRVHWPTVSMPQFVKKKVQLCSQPL